jgi:tyrosine-specific transport protein
MLVMPVETSGTGFFLSLFVLLVCWVFMTFTGLLLLEATLWVRNMTHFPSLTSTLLGSSGKVLSLFVYLFMNCASLVAYTSGGAAFMNQWVMQGFGFDLGYQTSCVLFTVIFGTILYFGASFIAKINVGLSIFMGTIYCYLVGAGALSFESDYLSFRSGFSGFFSFPLILAAFSYQMIVPSLCTYLKYDSKNLKKAIFVGTTIPLAIYCIWLLVIHGLFSHSEAPADPLKLQLSGTYLPIFADVFAFCALATSYLGLCFALFDFVRDLFKDVWKTPKQSSLTAVSLGPTLLLAMYFPKALLSCWDLSDGIGEAVLSGLIPVIMVWVGRYQRRLSGTYQAPGSKWALYGAGMFALTLFCIQWIKLF